MPHAQLAAQIARQAKVLGSAAGDCRCFCSHRELLLKNLNILLKILNAQGIRKNCFIYEFSR